MIHLKSHAEQLAAHLRGELLRGRWQGEMPGVAKLQEELGVNHTTISQALGLLEDEGLLISRGAKRRRQIVLPSGSVAIGMRIGIFLYEQDDHQLADFGELRHALIDAGFSVLVPPKSLTELDMNVSKIARMARGVQVDAWVVVSASREILEWFAEQPIPAIAWCGRPQGVEIASVSPSRHQSMSDAIRRLATLGHRRIVLLSGTAGRPAYFVDALEEHGIEVSDYNIPRMERSPEGLRKCLDSLYSLTPPTALIIDEACVFLSIKDELARRGIHAPQDVSLVCMDYHVIFSWYHPSVAHIRWKQDLVNRRILTWATNVSRGKNDKREMLAKSVFVDGGTVGKANTVGL